MKENIVLNIIVNENVNEGDVLAMQKDLEKDPYVLRTEYISKELAAKKLKRRLRGRLCRIPRTQPPIAVD